MAAMVQTATGAGAVGAAALTSTSWRTSLGRHGQSQREATAVQRGSFLSGSQLFTSHSTVPALSISRRVSPQVSAKLTDFIGGDLIRPDTGRFLRIIEQDGAVGCYVPPEGGYEGRYANRVRGLGYHGMLMTARGLGDVEAYLTKIHGVTPPHLGKQAVSMYYLPPELDYRLSILGPSFKGVLLWIIEGKVLSRAELQYLSVLPTVRPEVKVVVELGSSRNFEFAPLKDIVKAAAGGIGAAKDEQYI